MYAGRVQPVKFLAGLVLLLGVALAAQTSLPAFDVASVKPFKVPARGWAWGAPKMDPQHFSMPGSPLRDIILRAYGIADYQLTGLPDWAAHEFFTITASTAEPTTPAQMLLMLRRLLADRFQLRVTESEKTQPVYAIVPAPGGPKLKPRPADEPCPKGIDSAEWKASGAPRNSTSFFSGCTLPDLVAAFNRSGITRQIGRPVVDKTGLTGRYHMLVWQTYQPDTSYKGPGGRYLSMESFREAVEKELGLKLVDATATLHYIHVVSVARPSQN